MLPALQGDCSLSPITLQLEEVPVNHSSQILEEKKESVLSFRTFDHAGTFPFLPYLGECMSPGVSYTMPKLPPF